MDIYSFQTSESNLLIFCTSISQLRNGCSDAVTGCLKHTANTSKDRHGGKWREEILGFPKHQGLQGNAFGLKCFQVQYILIPKLAKYAHL